MNSSPLPVARGGSWCQTSSEHGQATVAGARLRSALLANELNTSPRLSPDGRAVVFIRIQDDSQELWQRGPDGRERQLVLHPGAVIEDLRWSSDGSMVVYRAALQGLERWRLRRLRLADLDHMTIPLTGSVAEYWLATSQPEAAACSVYTRRSDLPDLIRVNLLDPALSPALVCANPGFRRWIVDAQLRPRGGVRLLEDGSAQVVLGDDLDGAHVVLTVGVDDVADLAVQRFSRDGRQLFLLTSIGAETRRLIAIDSHTGAITTVFEHPQLDIQSYPIAGDGVWFDAAGIPDFCTVMGQRLQHHALTADAESRVRFLEPSADSSPVVIDRSANDESWLVVDVHDSEPIAYKMLNPTSGASSLLFVNRPELIGYELSKLEDFRFTAVDGREISSYVMRPLIGQEPFPTVLIIHGGPASRDIWRFNADAQYLASLGYLSLHVNYRGSSGFGRALRLAGHGEWGRGMQQDLYDAVDAGVAAGFIDPHRVVFMGGSYGGYASLLAACTRPNLVRCAISISAPCDLVSLANNSTPYWRPLAALVRRQIAGPLVGEGLDGGALRGKSPLHIIDDSCRPLLIAHGVRDLRVPVAQSDEFVEKCRSLGVQVRYLRFENEGHYVKTNSNRVILFSQVEDFLKEHVPVDDRKTRAAMHTSPAYRASQEAKETL